MTSFPFPYLAFEEPVPPVPVETGGEICIRVDRKWIPYIIGLFKTLVIDRTWESDQERCTGEANNLLTLFMLENECAEGVLEVEGCVHWIPAAPFIYWAPQNPYTQPGYVPPGYLAAPFYVVQSSDEAFLLLGLQAGDVISGLPSAPIVPVYPAPDSPYFELSLNGTGTVELHLLQFPTAGTAIVYKDDDLLTVVNIELNKDLISLPPETIVELVHEVTFDTPGTHKLRCIFTGRFNDEVIPFGFGGGIRKVVLCGFEEMGEFVDVRQNSEDECILEKSVDGETWTPFADLQLCAPVIRKVGNQVQYSLDHGVTFFTFPEADETILGDSTPLWPPESVPGGESGACLAAENCTAMFQAQVTQISSLLSVSTGALGIATAIAGALAFFIVPPVGAIIIGTAFGIVALGESGWNAQFDSELYDRLKCIFFRHASSDGAFTVDEFEEIVEDVQAESGGGWDFVETWLDWNGAVGLTRMATAAGIEDGECDDCFDFNITYNTPPVGGGGAASGPSGAFDGQTITLVSDSGGSFQCGTIYFIDFSVSPCCHVEIVAVRTASLFDCDPTTNVPKYRFDCDNNPQDNLEIEDGGTLVAVGYEGDGIRFGFDSDTAFELDVKLTSIP